MRQGNGYVIGFAAAICVVCSLLLSVVSGSLSARQEQNRVLDRQKNVLMAAGYDRQELDRLATQRTTTAAGEPSTALQKLYSDSFEELVVDRQGNVIEGKAPADLPFKGQSMQEPGDYLPIFRQRDPQDPTKTLAFIYPATGKGLWSTLFAYIAVRPNGSELVGIAFYAHGETPGLGAEIEKTWFTSSFQGKQLYDNSTFVGVEVVKGKVADRPGVAAQHAVDGISGATITANGVTRMMRAVPRMYDPFFQTQRGQKTALAPRPSEGAR
jgi:Na+-transporting NADH:ubiquinone oxidoreductase subunit C